MARDPSDDTPARRFALTKGLSSDGPEHLGIGPSCLGSVAIAAGVPIIAMGLFVWFGCRIEVGPGQFAVLIKKTGKDLTNEQLLADGPEFKGVQFDILKEGRWFKNPYYWEWLDPQDATVVSEGRVGVLVRRFGDPLPEGEVVTADESTKGIVRDPLKPGRYYLNLLAYDVEVAPAVKIEPGYKGVVTLLAGERPADPNVFVVEEGETGTQPFLLPPGTHYEYSNPYVYTVTSMDVRSQKFEMAGENSISFPSNDGFAVKVEGTIEWAPDIEKLAEVFVKYVDQDDLKRSGGIDNLQKKIILPFARSFFRTVGGLHDAADYITGATRIKVQNDVQMRLKERCAEEGVNVKAVIIRATEPPELIREQYARRELAKRELEQYQQEIITEIGERVIEGGKPKTGPDGQPVVGLDGRPAIVGGTPKLDDKGEPLRTGGRIEKVIQERMKDRQEKLGQVRVTIAQLIREAEQYRKVEVTKAEKELEVAKLHLAATEDKAAAVLAEGLAGAEVKVMKFKAEAAGVAEKVQAFGDGQTFAVNQLILKLAPATQSILSNTEGPFAKLFEKFTSPIDDRPTKKPAAKQQEGR